MTQALANENPAAYKVLGLIDIVSEIPLTAVGKVAKKTLRAGM